MAAAMLRTDAEKDDENFAKAMVCETSFSRASRKKLRYIARHVTNHAPYHPAPLLLRGALAQRQRRLPVPVPAMPAERPARQQIWAGDGLS